MRRAYALALTSLVRAPEGGRSGARFVACGQTRESVQAARVHRELRLLDLLRTELLGEPDELIALSLELVPWDPPAAGIRHEQ